MLAHYLEGLAELDIGDGINGAEAMRGGAARIELVSAIQEEEDLIEIVIFIEELLEDLTLPSITEILIEKIDQECNLLFILNRLSSVLHFTCLSMDLILFDKAHHKLRKTRIILEGLS